MGRFHVRSATALRRSFGRESTILRLAGLKTERTNLGPEALVLGTLVAYRRGMTTLPAALLDLMAGRPVQSLDEHEVELGLRYRLHGLISHAAHESTTSLLAEVPSALKRQLAAATALTEVDHQRSVERVQTLRGVFEHDGTQLRLIKGAALASLLYEDPRCRPFTDIDVVLDPDRDHSMASTLERLGMRSARVEAIVQLHRRGRPLHEFSPPLASWNVDLHLNPFGLLDRVRDPALVRRGFQRHDSGPFAGVETPVPALSVVIAAVNLARKGGDSLLHAADLARLFSADGLDWSLVDAISSAEGLRDVVDVVIEAVVQDLDIERPRRGRARARPWWAPTLGEVGVRHEILRRGSIVTMRRPLAHLPIAARAFASWYFPGPSLLDARGVPSDRYLRRIGRLGSARLHEMQAQRADARVRSSQS